MKLHNLNTCSYFYGSLNQSAGARFFRLQVTRKYFYFKYFYCVNSLYTQPWALQSRQNLAQKRQSPSLWSYSPEGTPLLVHVGFLLALGSVFRWYHKAKLKVQITTRDSMETYRPPAMVEKNQFNRPVGINTLGAYDASTNDRAMWEWVELLNWNIISAMHHLIRSVRFVAWLTWVGLSCGLNCSRRSSCVDIGDKSSCCHTTTSSFSICLALRRYHISKLSLMAPTIQTSIDSQFKITQLKTSHSKDSSVNSFKNKHMNGGRINQIDILNWTL